MPRNVLVVDDSDTMRKLVCLTLEGIGFKTYQAKHGLDALIQAKDIRPLDLVIADLNMPIMDGIKLLSQLRRTPGVSIVPVLFLTTEVDRTAKERARMAGASGWLTKPFQPEQLTAVVQKIVR
jgi:two-component system chemotaxis response regulator CheY